MADMKQRVQKNLEKNQGILPVGYKRLDNSMVKFPNFSYLLTYYTEIYLCKKTTFYF